MSNNNNLVETIAELRKEIPNLEPVGFNTKNFTTESNNIITAQLNTLIHLVLKTIYKINNLEQQIDHLEVQTRLFEEELERIKKAKDKLIIKDEEPKKYTKLEDTIGPKYLLRKKKK